MADRRIKPPRLMSRDELADHLSRFHGVEGTHPTLDGHGRQHHLVVSNHSHRSARLSEQTHRDWQ